jgi:type VI secretion system secreted protein VgrG
MLDQYGVINYRMKLSKADYPVEEYCVQYRESALAFVSRLMEHVGIFFYHEHADGVHTLVMSDSNLFTATVPGPPLVIATADHFGEIRSLATDTVFRPGAWVLTDFDFQGPTKVMKRQAHTHLSVSMMPEHERFDFPGGYKDQTVGDWLADLRMQAEEAHHHVTHGTGAVPSLMAGYRFTLDRHEAGDDGNPEKYLITAVKHHATETSYFPKDATPSAYSNTFEAIDAAVPYRPLRRTPKSVVQGAQTATVVAPSPSDPIQVDQYGRVKVHFHWDRWGKPAKGATSCWIRVSQNSAGGGFGGISIPHAGQEVVVDFLEGDPDRPLIVGRVHNADKTATTNLPSDKHKTITRDHGGNKIAMHGKAGTQHVSLITPGSLNLVARTASATSLSSAATDGGASFPAIANNPAGKGYANLQAAVNLADSDSASYPNATIGLDANMVTDGDINVFSLGDNNLWAMGNRNVYVQKNQVSWVQQNVTATVVGNVSETVQGRIVQQVTGNVTEQIKGHRLTLVKQDYTLGVDADMKIDISGKYVRVVDGNVTDQAKGHRLLIVNQDDNVGVDGKQVTDVKGDIKMTSSSGAVSITASSQISLTVGGNSIVISASGITITSAGPMTLTAPMINMNC